MSPFNLDACISQLLKKQLLHETVLKEICEKTKEVLMREGNVVHVQAPVTVVGDIHGCGSYSIRCFLEMCLLGQETDYPFFPYSQFYDLVEIFRIGGYAPSTNYLFLGTHDLYQTHLCGRLLILYPCAPPRGLRRPRPILRRNYLPPNLSQTPTPLPNSPNSGQPRIPRRNANIRLLHRMCTEIRVRLRLVLLH
jgi:hypothetical protein